MIRMLFAFLFAPLLGSARAESPFTYDFHLYSLPGNHERTILCFHGYGGSYQIADLLKNLYNPPATLVSFNFPEHSLREGKQYDPKTASFGSIDELLPALYVMKKIILEQEREAIDLYGFSAGGGAVVNLIRVLNGSDYDLELKGIGIGAEEKKQLLSAIERGIILLDAPLKSVEEIIDFKGPSEELKILAKKYRDHAFRPIDSLKMLKGISLRVLLYFDKNDEVLSNRDDQLYIERFQESQSGQRITVLIGDEGGHVAPHYSLWEEYAQMASGQVLN